MKYMLAVQCSVFFATAVTFLFPLFVSSLKNLSVLLHKKKSADPHLNTNVNRYRTGTSSI